MINKILIKLCKEVLRESYEKDGREAGAILNINTMEYAIHEATKYTTLDFAEDELVDYHLIHDNADIGSCIIIHNHNDASSFSARDVLSLVDDIKTIGIIVITSRCSINIITKDRHTDYSEVSDCIRDNYKVSVITPDIRNMMKSKGLIERRVTTWENIQQRN